MLSRIAESLFWIGRYVERADDTARLLDIHLQILLEDPWAEEDLACRSLLQVMDRQVAQPDVKVGRDYVLDVLAYDRSSPSSITGALVAARENARRAREILSTEFWETLNTTWNKIPSMVRPTRPPDLFAWVRERAAVVAGIMDSSTSRDLTWQFMVLGRYIERADMTARLLMTKNLSGSSGPTWTTLLRSCGAYEAFLHSHGVTADDENAAGFLLSNRLFPRSIGFSLAAAEEVLERLRPADERTGIAEGAERILGRVRTSLEYRSLRGLVLNLPREMTAVQDACAEATDDIRARYFPSGPVIAWVGDSL